MKSRQGRAGRIGVACAIAAGTGLTSKPIEHFKVGVKVKRGQVLGQQGKGLWSLFVVDAAVGDAGTLHCWELSFYGQGQEEELDAGASSPPSARPRARVAAPPIHASRGRASALAPRPRATSRRGSTRGRRG